MIEVRDFSVRLGGATVLQEVGLNLCPGEIIGLIGPPESGKSVLLKALAGLLHLHSGSVMVSPARQDSTHEPVASTALLQSAQWRQRIGMAFQNDALFDALTLFDNVAFPLRRRRMAEHEINDRVRHRLGEVELAAASRRFPNEVSGGMRKRAGIARATVIDPEIGFFDDPIAGLDPLTGATILALIVRLTATLNMATIIVSNDLPVLLPVCQRVVMLHHGRVVYSGHVGGLMHSTEAVVRQFVTGSDEGPL